MRRISVRIGIVMLGVLFTFLGALGQSYAQNDDGSDIFLPLISSGSDEESVVRPITGVTDDGEVFGLIGTLRKTEQQTFGHFFLTEDNQEWGLAGTNPAIERLIGRAASQQPNGRVKLWGKTFPGAASLVIGAVEDGDERIDLIVASAIEPIGSTPEAAPTEAPLPKATVKFNVVNLMSLPNQSSTMTVQARPQDQCTVVGRNELRTWWQLACDGGKNGWIDARFVTVEGSTASVPLVTIVVVQPTATPSPIPTPTPRPTVRPTRPPSVDIGSFAGWKSSFYPNISLEGAPAVVDDIATISFNWGAGSPYRSIPFDGFSARFERRRNFPAGFYRFTVRADDGVRFWLDDELLIDGWRGATGESFSVGRALAGGIHNLRLEYYERVGNANIDFAVRRVQQRTAWQAAYFDGTSLSGPVMLAQAEPRADIALNYDWGTGSPGPDTLGTDRWSAQWSGRFNFSRGDYVFRARADDGVRVFIDGIRIIDGWNDGFSDLTNRFLGVGAGEHTIRVEYYERSGNANIEVWWFRELGNDLEE